MKRVPDQPRLLGLVSAILAVGLGIGYLAAAGAPAQFIAINLATRCQSQRTVLIAFGAAWASVVVAALGNHPTPVVGYGGSAMIGYLLSTALLPRSCENAGERGLTGRLSA